MAWQAAAVVAAVAHEAALVLYECFFDDGECRSKNPMPYPGLFVRPSLSGKKMMPRIDALQDCDQDLGCDCPRGIPAYTGSQGCLRIVQNAKITEDLLKLASIPQGPLAMFQQCPFQPLQHLCDYSISVFDSNCATCDGDEEGVTCLPVPEPVDGRGELLNARLGPR